MKIYFLIVMIFIAGCSTSKSKYVSDDLPTMKEVYDRKFNKREGLDRNDVARDIQTGDRDWNKGVRTNLSPLKKEFTYLPNPLLTMYIFPHLTDAGSPVPGYTTFFKFYEKDQVGLASELERFMPMEITDNKPETGE